MCNHSSITQTGVSLVSSICPIKFLCQVMASTKHKLRHFLKFQHMCLIIFCTTFQIYLFLPNTYFTQQRCFNKNHKGPITFLDIKQHSQRIDVAELSYKKSIDDEAHEIHGKQNQNVGGESTKVFNDILVMPNL